MKRISILFACIFALSACDENQQVIHILSAPSELDSLDITAYSDDIGLSGGAALSPSFNSSVFDYTVYIAKDANRFVINAGTEDEATVSAVCVNDGETGLEFDFFGDASKTIHLTVQIKHMERTEYRLNVERADMVPPAEDVKITVDPPIGAFFIGRGVLPKIEVTANLPAAGGTLSYQWFINTLNNTRDGFPVSGANGSMTETGDVHSASYTMKSGETFTVRTIYYYAEITNTIGGRATTTVSAPCAVTFINKGELDAKSTAMVAIPAGAVDTISNPSLPWAYVSLTRINNLPPVWNTPGFSMGKYPVTWELWETVFEYADTSVYRLSHGGNQGGAYANNITTNDVPRPIGNRLNPVTNISWRDAVVWCNAYSEMDGFDPVYRDSAGNVLRNSRDAVEQLIDTSQMAGRNGYRLPANAEWMYAARGANPSMSPPWTNKYTGTNNQSELKDYFWSNSPEQTANAGAAETTEVGRMLPNSIGLHDMMGMVIEWVWWLDYSGVPGIGVKEADPNIYAMAFGLLFNEPITLNPAADRSLDWSDFLFRGADPGFGFDALAPYSSFCGLRLAQGGI